MKRGLGVDGEGTQEGEQGTAWESPLLPRRRLPTPTCSWLGRLPSTRKERSAGAPSLSRLWQQEGRHRLSWLVLVPWVLLKWV